TTIPTEATEIFTTAQDNQSQVEIHVLQGERELAQHNKSLGRFHLTGIPPAPRGTPQIEVTFDIDSNGILNVSAEDQGSGEKQEIEITGSTNLADDEIEEMKEEAEQHAEEDERRKELIEAKNQADHLIYQTEDLLEEHADEVEASEKQEVENALDDLKDVMEESEDPDEIREAMEQVTQVSQVIGQKMYDEAGAQQAAGGPGAGAAAGGPGGAAPGGATGGNGSGSSEDVQDADYEVVDEDE
ncbi:MAG: Hsp70 family protein, partial [bacterium]